MKKTALRSPRLMAPVSADIRASELPFYRKNWLFDCEVRQHSPQVLSTRNLMLSKLEWFLQLRGHDVCGPTQVREFLAYLTHGHLEPGGRWGNPSMTQPVRPRTVRDYHSHLRTFFRWLIAQKMILESPIENIGIPISRPDQIQPFTEEQVEALLAAASKSLHPQRDEAIMMFLLDTGVRVSEIAGVRQKDLDVHEGRCIVRGKGNKHRTVHFGRSTSKALFFYLRDQAKDPEAPVFRSDRGETAGEALTRWGVRQIIERAGKVAKIENTRCSPHTFRHTMAVTFLRNGGQVFALKEILGHTDLKMTSRYVALAQADIAKQHRQFSPVDNFKRR